MPASKVSPPLKSKCLALLRKGESPQEIAERYTLIPSTVRGWKRQLEDAGETVPRLAKARKVRQFKEQKAAAPALVLPPLASLDSAKKLKAAAKVDTQPADPGAATGEASPVRRPSRRNGSSLFVRLNPIARLDVPGRVKALAARSAIQEAQVIRAVLVLGIAAAERDIGAIARAAELTAGVAHG